MEQSYKQVKDALGLEIVSNAFWGIVMLVVGALMLRRALGGRVVVEGMTQHRTIGLQ